MYTAVPYVFHHDYCGDFFNYSYVTGVKYETAERDFVRNFTRLLDRLHVTPSYPVAESLVRRMSDRNLHFHTPVRILAMLQCATRMKIKLAWWEEVAIWFHNAIYVPGRNNEDNAWASAKFMEAMMSPYVANRKLTTIAIAIHYLGRSNCPSIPRQHQLLLDLGNCHFLFEQPGYKTAIHSEIEEMVGYCGRDNVWDAYKERLIEIITKGSVFRTRIFESCEERATRQVLQLALQQEWAI